MSTTAQHLSSEVDRSDQANLCLLLVKDAQDGIKGAEIADKTGLPIGSVSRALDALRKTGDVYRDDDKTGANYFPAQSIEDKHRLIYLYEKEQEGRALNKMRQAANVLIAKFTPQERVQLRAIFERMNKEV